MISCAPSETRALTGRVSRLRKLCLELLRSWVAPSLPSTRRPIRSRLSGSDPTQFTAISLVTGVEPLLTMVAARQQTGGAQGRPQGVDLNGSFGGMFGGVGVP